MIQGNNICACNALYLLQRFVVFAETRALRFLPLRGRQRGKTIDEPVRLSRRLTVESLEARELLTISAGPILPAPASQIDAAPAVVVGSAAAPSLASVQQAGSAQLSAADQPLYQGIADASVSPANAGLVLVTDIGAGIVAPLHATLPVTPGVATLTTGISGLAFDAAGDLFGATSAGPGSTSNLVRIDPSTGVQLSSTPIANASQPLSIGDLTFQPGTNRLYGIGTADAGPTGAGQLYTIDTATGAATPIGTPVTGKAGGLAFAPTGTLYFASVAPSGAQQLYTLDPATGKALTGIALKSAPGESGIITGMAVREDGVLVGSDSISGNLVTINTTSGALTVIPLLDPDTDGSSSSAARPAPVRGIAGDIAFQPVDDGALTQVFHDDFEDGPGNWTIDNSGATYPGLWHYSIGRADDHLLDHSPQDNFYYGQFETPTSGGDYLQPYGSQGLLISPSISVPAAGTSIASFSYQLQTRLELDRDFVDVSVIDGSTITPILSRQDGTLPQSGITQWITATADLTQFAGQSVRLQFSFRTGDPAPIDPEGWFVDDVVVANVANVAGSPLSITKSDDRGGSSASGAIGIVAAGDELTYTVDPTTSSGTVVGDVISDPLPAEFAPSEFPSWLTYNSSTNTLSGTIPAGQALPFTVSGSVSSTAAVSSRPQPLINTIVVTAPDGSTATATDEDDLLTIIKVDNHGGSSLPGAPTGTVMPGDQLTYTITVANSGPDTVSGANFTDPLPANFTSANYSVVLSGGATDSNPTGSGNIDDTVTLPGGGSITYTVTGTVASTAAGVLANTATVTAANRGTTGSTTAIATDVDQITVPPGFVIIKADDRGGSSINGLVGTVPPGGELTYTITVTNASSTPVPAANVTDTLPNSFVNGNYTTQLSGGATDSNPMGSGDIDDTVALPIGGTIVYTVVGMVAPGALGTLTNTAAVTVASQGAPATATDVDNIAVPAVLTVTKTDDRGGSSSTGAVGTVAPGNELTYTITVSNTGTLAVTGASVADTLPAGFTDGSYTTQLSGGASDTSPTGSGNLDDIAALPVGGSIIYTVTGTVSSSAVGTLTNTATVSSATQGAPVAATDVDDIALPSAVTITKTDDRGGASRTGAVGAVAPGSELTYTIAVTNNSAAPVTGASVIDPLPAGFIGASYTTQLSGGATDSNPTGTGSIDDDATLPIGGSITYTVTGTVSPSAVGTLTNTATVTAPNQVPAGATDVDDISLPASLTITKSDDRGGSSSTGAIGTVTPGNELTYTITVTNISGATVTGASLTDSLPAGFMGASYTAQLSGGATDSIPAGAGNIADTISLPSGSSITYTVAGTVSANAVGTLTNTASVTTPNAGTTAATTVMATDEDDIGPASPLTVVKVDSTGGSSATGTNGLVVPGQALTYTITVTNTSSTPTTGVTVSDPLPSEFNVSSSTLPSGPITLPANGSMTFSVTGTVASSAAVLNDPQPLVNKVTVSAPGGITATATDEDDLLTVSKTDSAGGSSVGSIQGSAVAGQALTYTIVVSNSGPNSLPAVSVADNFPAGFSVIHWSAVPSSGSSDTNPSGSGNISDSLTLAPGGSIVYTVSGTVSPSAAVRLSNTVSVTATSRGVMATATDVDAVVPMPALTITKTDDHGGSSVSGAIGTVAPGNPLTYTITVTNTSLATITGASVTDPLLAGFTNASYTAALLGGATDAHPAGAGNINDTVNLPSGGSITYTVTGTVGGTVTAALTNTASVTAPDGTIATAVDQDNLLSITKVDSRGGSSVTGASGTVAAGESLTYTIVVSNSGPGTVSGASVSDAFPANLTDASYSSLPAGGASDSSPTGSGGTLLDTVTLPSGGSITYTVTGTVAAAATTALSNTAMVTATNGSKVSATNGATDVDSLLSISKTDSAGGSSITGASGTVTAGGPLIYTITVSNSGPAAVTNVTVSDTFPSQFLPSSSNLPSSPITLGPGQSMTFVVGGTVSSSALGTLTNTVTATVPNGAPVTAAATDTDVLEQTVQFITPLSVFRPDGPFIGSSGSSSVGLPAGSNSISGFLWDDVNQNGVWDAGETGMAGWRVFVDTNHTGVFDSAVDPVAFTTADGMYSFSNIAAGSYWIGFVQSDVSNGTVVRFANEQFSGSNAAAATAFHEQVVTTPGSAAAGSSGVAGAPNLGVFLYSPLVRPADDLLGHLDPTGAATIDTGSASLTATETSLFASLQPWQTFVVDNTADQALEITKIEESLTSIDPTPAQVAQFLTIFQNVGGVLTRLNLAADGTLVDSGDTQPAPISVPADGVANFIVFYDPAIRDANHNVIQQFPDWFGDAAGTNPAHTFAAGDNLQVVTQLASNQPGPSYPVLLVGGSTYDSDIFYDGAVNNLDLGRLSDVLSVSSPTTSSQPGFDPTSDINVRFPNGAGEVDAQNGNVQVWPIDGPPPREIGLGDFAPLEVEWNRARAPFLDLDTDNSSGIQGTGFLTTFASAAVPIADNDANFANFAQLDLNSLTVTIENPLAGDQLNATLAGTSITLASDSTATSLHLSGNDTVAHYLQVLKTITFQTTDSTPRTVTIDVVAVGSTTAGAGNSFTNLSTVAGDVSQVTGNTAVALVNVVPTVNAAVATHVASVLSGSTNAAGASGQSAVSVAAISIPVVLSGKASQGAATVNVVSAGTVATAANTHSVTTALPAPNILPAVVSTPPGAPATPAVGTAGAASGTTATPINSNPQPRKPAVGMTTVAIANAAPGAAASAVPPAVVSNLATKAPLTTQINLYPQPRKSAAVPPAIAPAVSGAAGNMASPNPTAAAGQTSTGSTSPAVALSAALAASIWEDDKLGAVPEAVPLAAGTKGNHAAAAANWAQLAAHDLLFANLGAR
jgi:uncharacterized repeat protein (TIGR01451 family)